MHLMGIAAQRIIRRPGKCECILEKTHKSKGCNHDYIGFITHKSLIFLCYSRIFLHFRKNIRNSLTVLFKLHISRIQSGAHMSERAGQEIVKSWPHSQQKTSCLRARHHLSSPASKPSASGWCSDPLLPPAPTTPDLLLLSSIQANPSTVHFCGCWFPGSEADVGKYRDSLYESHILLCYWMLAQESYL